MAKVKTIINETRAGGTAIKHHVVMAIGIGGVK